MGIIVAFFTLLAGISACGVLLKKIAVISHCRMADVELLCMAFLLAPVLISLLLWCGMFFCPGKISPSGYVYGVIGIFISIGLLQLHSLVCFWSRLRREILAFFRLRNIPLSYLYAGALVLVLLWIGLAVWAWLIPVYNSDVVEYLLGGDFFASSRAIVYQGLFINPQNVFWYHTYHSFCLPLFAAWGCFLHNLFGAPQDWYFKFTSLYYWSGLNFIALLFLVRCGIGARKNSWIIGIIAFLALNCVPITFDFVFFFGCDFFRIALLTCFFLLLWLYVKNPHWSICIFVGLLGAAATAAHGLSVVICLLFCIPMLFAQTNWKRKIAQIALAGGIILLFSGTHYILQSCIGDHWVWGIKLLSSDEAAVTERFQSRIFLWFKGYLGVLCNIKMFSFYLPLLLAVCLMVICRKKLKLFAVIHWSFLCCFGAVWLLIAWKLFYNFRYQYTLYPLSILLASGIFLTFGSSPKEYKLLFAFSILSCLCSIGILLQNGITFLRTSSLTHMQNERALPPLLPEASSSELWSEFAQKRCSVLFVAKNQLYYREAQSPISYSKVFPRCVMHSSGRAIPATELPEKYQYLLINRQYKENYPQRISICTNDWCPIFQNERDILYVSKKYEKETTR